MAVQLTRHAACAAVFPSLNPFPLTLPRPAGNSASPLDNSNDPDSVWHSSGFPQYLQQDEICHSWEEVLREGARSATNSKRTSGVNQEANRESTVWRTIR